MIALLLAAAVTASRPIVQIESGRLAGERLADGSAVFRGVPFAQAPVGDLRWQPPQAVKHWSGIKRATDSAPACPQPDNGWNKDAAANSSEDCLYLEIRSPDLKPPKPLPVMVWIHGGANYSGSGSGTVMSSIPDRGIVLVSLQYRLGALGFMSHPALTRESAAHASGNYGLMDQQAALRWVKANIGRFGGDPRNVTVFGESAGGQDVGLLLVAPGGRGLFEKAIEESGTPQFGQPPRSLTENEALGEVLAVKAGAPPHATASQLRRIPAENFVSVQRGKFGPIDAGIMWASAVVDGAVLKEAPAATLAKGDQARVPLIIGANTQESVPFAPMDPDTGAVVRAVFGANAERVLTIYGLQSGGDGNTDPLFGPAAIQAWSDVGFHCPAVVVARAQARSGAPVWQYQFGYAQPGSPTVHHASELRYVFNAAGEEGIPNDAAPLQAYWVNFAKTGDPNGGGLPQWPRFDEQHRTYLDFEQSGARAQDRLRDDVCRFLDVP